MKVRAFISICILLAVISAVAGFVLYVFHAQDQKSKEEAISLIQRTYPELLGYPSDNLPPRLIKAEKADDGWHVAFIQNGSGVPIIRARCFLVSNDVVISESSYNANGEVGINFSAKTCTMTADATNTNTGLINQSQTCGIENCHGLQIQCGFSPAEMCTAMYALGDKCREHAECGVVNGNCQQIANPLFDACKSCVEACDAKFTNDPEALFACESECE